MAVAGKARLCMIGAGNMANAVHYPSFTRVQGAEVTALAELDAERGRKASERWGVPRVYPDYRKMIETEKPHAVCVIMPPQHMFDVVLACLRAKVCVFTEKPPGLTAYQTRSYARVARENGVFGMVGFNRRYIPVVTQAKQWVESHGGPVRLCVSSFYKGDSPPAYYDGQLDAIGCDAIHAVDFLRFACGGRVRSVASLVNAYGAAEPDAWQALVRFDNDASGVLHTFWNCGGRQHLFELHAVGASAYVDPDGRTVLKAQNGKKIEQMECPGISKREEMYLHSGFLAQAQHFVDCVVSGREPSSSFEDAVGTMDLVEAIRVSDISD
jgi:predicted dehydrogenase